MNHPEATTGFTEAGGVLEPAERGAGACGDLERGVILVIIPSGYESPLNDLLTSSPMTGALKTSYRGEVLSPASAARNSRLVFSVSCDARVFACSNEVMSFRFIQPVPVLLARPVTPSILNAQSLALGFFGCS